MIKLRQFCLTRGEQTLILSAAMIAVVAVLSWGIINQESLRCLFQESRSSARSRVCYGPLHDCVKV